MKVCLAEGKSDASLWDQFVEEHCECTNCHRWAWKRVIETSLRWPTFYLVAGEAPRITGILPLVWQKSRMFGSFLTSMPFLNAGGIVGEDKEAKDALLAEAIKLAKQLRVKYLELRQRGGSGLDLPMKMHKVAMVLPLQAEAETMWSSLPHKVRTDVRKAMNSGLMSEFGGEELLSDFYEVFARNMRELGTPVYSQAFFSAILKNFPTDSYICVVRHDGRAVATSFLTGYRQTLEAVWSSSLYDYIHLKPNMFLYWKIVCFAGERGYQFFDFGRSSLGSGTHRFKKQWGTQEIPLYWAYWVPDGNPLPELNKENVRYRFAIKLWQKLPLPLTKLIGPAIVRCLP